VNVGAPVAGPETFTLELAGRKVPVAVWTAADATGPRPLVLLGHGGGGDKLTTAPLAERIVGDLGFVAAAIDGPVHGDRRTDAAPRDVVLEDFRALWRQGTPRIDEMVADLGATLDELVGRPDVDPGRVAWVGMSMGTAYGLPFVAADARVRAAVLGMWGLSYPSTGRLAADAPRVRCPVLFQCQTEDQVMTAAGQAELFALLGADDKRLATYPGTHAPAGPEQVDDTIAFLRRHLAGS
jgi:dienelactone hydrolase